ncbi:MAG: hypothetical protein M1392_05860 [Gammaproteobacteria bacterium]|nr:hypothetical protein [Gammaproteobacteria bacterium]
MDKAELTEFFQRTPRLAELCTQGGWPAPESLKLDIVQQQGAEVVCDVRFDEVIMEGSGCEAGRTPCWGQFRLRLDERGKVAAAELIEGARGSG